MKFYDDTKLLYLETDASGVGLGVALLQVCKGTTCQKDVAPDNIILHPIVFASKSLTGAECRYSNIKREAPRHTTWAQKCHHYCFAREVLIITDHKPLVAIFKKDMTMLSQCIQCILLKIYQYRVQIVYKPGPKIFTADWLSQHNHEEGKDKPIRDMNIRIDSIQSVTDIPECITIKQIQQVSAQDEHLQHLKKQYNCRLDEHRGSSAKQFKTVLML